MNNGSTALGAESWEDSSPVPAFVTRKSDTEKTKGFFLRSFPNFSAELEDMAFGTRWNVQRALGDAAAIDQGTVHLIDDGIAAPLLNAVKELGVLGQVKEVVIYADRDEEEDFQTIFVEAKLYDSTSDPDWEIVADTIDGLVSAFTGFHDPYICLTVS